VACGGQTGTVYSHSLRLAPPLTRLSLSLPLSLFVPLHCTPALVKQRAISCHHLSSPCFLHRLIASSLTQVLGNATINWIESVLEAGPTHPPFFAWIGPHAPHLPSTPAPWYTDHPVGLHTAPRDTPYYNYSALDHHEILANQPIINDADARAIDAEYAKRLRSLLSVDDIVVALHELLTKHNEWHNTFLFVSSTSHLSVLATLVPNTAAVCVLHFCTLFVCAACTLLFVKGISLSLRISLPVITATRRANIDYAPTRCRYI
jgi:hypothetical protein